MGAYRSRLLALAGFVVGILALVALVFAVGPTRVVASPGSAPEITATPTLVCDLGWHAVTAPNPGPTVILRGVAAITSADAWAVGDYNGGRNLLTMHWDGAAWSVVPNPNPGGNYANFLYAVSGRSTDDVWAVGFYREFSPNSLIMHWNGSAWSYESGPYPGTIPWLYGVAAIATNDVWAVGYQNNSHSLIYHWNGSAWSISSSPDIGTLYGVGGTSQSDAWAVGANGILHWDGSAWTISPAPTSAGILRDVDAVSLSNAIAVGDTGILHWTGSKWLQYPSPSGGTSVEELSGSDAWVTGTSGMLHWEGAQWSMVSSPYGGPMAGVSAPVAINVWAVGSSNGAGVTELYSYLCPQGTVTSTPVGTATPLGTATFTGTATASATATATATATPVCGPNAWNVVASQNVGADDNYLFSVAAVSATDVWAVGYYCSGDCATNPARTLVEHWDGSAWSVVTSPNVGTGSNGLLGVSGTAANNVWAVGSYLSSGVDRTLIMRWDGSAWNVVSSPNVGAGRNVLSGVEALAGNDAVAVGTAYSGTVGLTLIERWNGSAWNVISSPDVGAGTNVLNAVSALAGNDVWAVGTYYNGNLGQTLTLHWTGGPWTVVSSPNVGTEPNFLYGVTAVAAGDVWAVGHYFINGSVTQTLVEHWNGSAWSVVAGANVGAGPNYLRAVTAVAAGDVWAVGYYCNGSCGSGNPFQTLVEHWNGSSWSVVPSQNVGAGYNYLAGVAAPSAGETWAVGYYRNASSVYQTLTLHRPGPPCVSATPTPTISASFTPLVTRTGTQTATPASPTASATAGGTGTATVTPCSMDFSDVHPSDYFYQAVSYLYCAGVISGYGDGTFRPYNNTIRGQLCKIIVLAEGFQLECPAPGHFSDVPPTHPFFCYIEAAYSHGIISGYGDGTFRPYNNVTRGQLCKIVVLAEGWADDCPTPGHFSDVPPTHAFFCFVETAYSHGIISGYDDGTFRPENSATRGQICKIVYQAVTGP